MAITRFGLEGYGVRRTGSFAGKTASPTHPVGILTRFGLEGYGVRRAGSFADKTASVVVVVVTPTPTIEPGGAGAPLGKPTHKPTGPYAPAFPRRYTDLYQRIPLEVPVEIEPEPEVQVPEKLELSTFSPLSITMGLGERPIVIGITQSERLRAQQIQDEEDAIIAILLSAL